SSVLTPLPVVSMARTGAVTLTVPVCMKGPAVSKIALPPAVMLPARVRGCPTLLVWIKTSPDVLAYADIPDWEATSLTDGTVPTVNAGPFKKPNEPPAAPASVPTVFGVPKETGLAGFVMPKLTSP